LEVIIIPVELLVACRQQYNPGITKDPPVKSQVPPEALDLNQSTEFQSTSTGTGTGVPNKTLKVGSTTNSCKNSGCERQRQLQGSNHQPGRQHGGSLLT
jgi:hypothetical protein